RLRLAAVAAEKTDRLQSALARDAEAAQHVLALARRRDRDRDVALAAERLDLPRKDQRKAEIVAGGGQRRAVRRQRDRRDGRPVARVSHRQFGREMLRVGGAAAIAEEQQLPAALDCLGPNRKGLRERFAQA